MRLEYGEGWEVEREEVVMGRKGRANGWLVVVINGILEEWVRERFQKGHGYPKDAEKDVLGLCIRVYSLPFHLHP